MTISRLRAGLPVQSPAAAFLNHMSEKYSFPLSQVGPSVNVNPSASFFGLSPGAMIRSSGVCVHGPRGDEREHQQGTTGPGATGTFHRPLSYPQRTAAGVKICKARCAMRNTPCGAAIMPRHVPRARAPRRPFLLACAALAACVAAVVTTPAQSSTDKWWTGYGSGPDNSRYFPSKQITRGNVSRLQVAWTYPFGDTGSGPIVVRGVIYGRGRNGSLVALDAATGTERWVRESMTGMTSRGMNYWESADGRDQRLIFAMNSLLQEVDARTGKSVMSFGTNGVVDLRVGLDGRDPESIGNIQSSIPGEVFDNLVIVGSATGEGYMSPPGDIRAYDVVTGRLVWTFHTVPRPGEFGYDTWPKEAWKYIGGVNNWAEMTVDTRRGIVYIPLGSPTYDFYGADRIGSNLFGTSIVALDARTGKRRWHFQFVHHDLWDLDPSAAPQLTTIRHNGRTRDVVVASAKTPWLYVFDRETGEPIWPIEERPVPKSDMPGEQSWPTQPYPTNPPPHARQSFGVEDISPYLPADEAARFTTRLRAAKNLGLFTPINYADTVHIPTSNGGVLFGGMASEPATGAVYVVSHDNPGILRLLRPGETDRTRRAAAVTRASRVSAELPELPRSRSPRIGQHAGARLRDGGPGEQHRRGRATLRRGRDPDGDRRRQRTDAVVSASDRLPTSMRWSRC